jgi:3'-phosphoadenosine 5'-phosphosulfate sulfotransferase (PAPS reductase)/FAD synthetase
MPETLDFVRDCGEHWGVNITWLELDVDYTKPKEEMIFYKEVNYKTASRQGEPFTKLIEHWNTQRDVSESNKEFQKKGMSILPNPRARFCTDYLKIRALQDFAKKKNYKQWTNILGLRYDEPKRVGSQKNYQTKNRMSEMPMYDAKDTKHDVHEFWSKHNFDLGLPIINGESPHGNCDLCFLKSHNKILSLVKEEPKKAKWWADTEIKAKNVFRRDRPSYIKYIEITQNQQDMFLDFEDDDMDCFCHD